MHTLVINDKEYGLPSDLTLTQWKAVMKSSASTDDVIKIVFGCSDEEVSMIPEQTKTVAVGFVSNMLFPVIDPTSIGYLNHKVLDFDTITFGEFIDLEVYNSEGIEKNIIEMVQVLYKAANVDDWPISACWNGVHRFLTWRNMVYHNYKNLFESTESDDDNPVSLRHMWYDVAMIVAQNNILNLEPVLNRPLIECLNWLAWNKDQQRKLQELTK